MQLEHWARKWGVPHSALAELRDGLLGLDYQGVRLQTGKSEAAVQAEVRLETARQGARVWRNNVGAYQDTTGAWVRYGMANETAQVNKVLKSADLIGLRPVLIRQQHMGQTLGQFCSFEVKHGNWRYSATAHEQAQLNWANLVNSLGGHARFVTSAQELFT